jgi:molybdopterin-dependent oxidoreductase alpha subunit
VSQEPPKLRVRPYKKAAGGLSAVLHSTGYAFEQAGVGRSLRTLLKVNQKDGFDCPSCAWPDPEDRASLEFCENGAKAVADEATTKRATPDFFREWSLPRLAEQPDVWLNQQGRLTHPMVRRPGAEYYEEIAWDDAFALLGHELAALAHPDEAIFYTSGRTSNETAFLYQLFARQFGTNNMPDCSNMCHESSGTGLSAVLGTGKGTVQLSDFTQADAIFLIGQNPGTNHPRMLSTLREAKLRGAAIVAVNPLREPGLVRFRHPQKMGDLFGRGVEIADLYLQVRVGGDIALLKGIMKAMLEAEAGGAKILDQAFIAEHTSGYDEFAAALLEVSWDEICRESGIAREQIMRAAGIAMASERTICCWAMGITQHKHGVANVQEIVNFLLLRGNLGRPGAGACPVRGHSNVQGDRTMGIWEHMPKWTDRLAEAFSFTPPTRAGLDTVGSIRAMHDGRAKVFFAMGGNFLSATPDTDLTAEALRRCRLTVHVATKLNRAHLVTGDAALLLPCLGRTEKDPHGFVTVEDSMSIVHSSQGTLAPASQHLLSETAIVCKMARAVLGSRSRVDWEGFAESYDTIRDAIARVIPGFHDFNQRVRAPGGFVLPNTARERQFETGTGKACFTVNTIPRIELLPGQLLLTTIRTHDQFNTTIYGMDDRYRGIYGHRRVILLHPDDMRELGVTQGQRVTVTSHFRGETRTAPDFVVVPYDIPRRCAATYFPEANVLVPLDSYADRSRTPTSKSVVVTLQAAPA